MIVAPQGKLKIIKNVGWNNSDKHIRYFTTESDRQTYMTMKTAYTLDNYSYIRAQNVIRVGITADNLYQCDYLMYQNKGFGDKWFYAYITDVKYSSAETSEISFEIDDFQTWFDSSNLKATFVEREHVADDTIGAHTIAEDIGIEELNIQHACNFWFNNNGFEVPWKLFISVKPTLMGDFLQNQDYFQFDNNQIHPQMYVVDLSDSGCTQLEQWLKNTTLTGVEIAEAYIAPDCFIDPEHDIYNPKAEINNLLTEYSVVRPSYYEYHYKDGHYTPKNNKLFTYPYTMLEVYSTDGDSSNYKWEHASGGKVDFDLLVNCFNGAQCTLVPENYEVGPDVDARSVGSQHKNDVCISTFPHISLPMYDGIKPQNLLKGVNSIITSLTSGIKGFKDVVTGANKGASTNISGATGGIMNLASNTPQQAPSTSGDNLLLSYNMIGYAFYCMGIKGEVAEIVDNYFTKFGYKVNKIKVPELTSRPSFNYVKTNGFEYNGEAPNDAKVHISNIFNNGVTLWHTNDIGNYNLNNSLPS